MEDPIMEGFQLEQQDERQWADANMELAERLTAILSKLAERGVLNEDELRLLCHATGIRSKDVL